ncbi:hypothetical protein KKE85_01250 [Patescibacteria group bacterium]|nr:hypothetical protein [Patescibacteria group bacterium]
MKLIFKNNSNKNITDLMRTAGYYPKEGASFVREISGLKYPRFHIYLEQNEDNIVINLHLDQKKPSYQGSKAHNTEYDGRVVEDEAERLKQFFRG